ncbi:MAG: SGNH/GDSL hydrolase family protein [Gammaproteobacteria bacterium]|nr:SGNH/GDSL hydrolase family protein [Gammaproteobacteria bacterium]
MFKRIFSTLVFILIASNVQLALAALPKNFTQIYFFGDSLSDMGNYRGADPDVNTHVDYPDDGEGQTAPVTNWIDNPNNTYTPTETWAEFLAQKYHIQQGSVVYSLNAIPSRLGGNDWAVSGNTTLQTYSQVQDFEKRLTTNNQYPDPDKTLYVVWTGPNDLLALANYADPAKVAPIVVRNGMENIYSTIETLHNDPHSKAKYILMLGMPDISLTPLFSNPNHIESEYKNKDAFHEVCTDWNELLFSQTDPYSLPINPPVYELKEHYPDLQIYTYDVNPILKSLIADPAKYGFQSSFDLPSGSEAVCDSDSCKNNQLEWYFARYYPIYGKTFDDPNKFIFYNAIHPTTHTHEILADNVYKDAALFSLQGKKA